VRQRFCQLPADWPCCLRPQRQLRSGQTSRGRVQATRHKSEPWYRCRPGCGAHPSAGANPRRKGIGGKVAHANPALTYKNPPSAFFDVGRNPKAKKPLSNLRCWQFRTPDFATPGDSRIPATAGHRRRTVQVLAAGHDESWLVKRIGASGSKRHSARCAANLVWHPSRGSRLIGYFRLGRDFAAQEAPQCCESCP
jgi:hypothetical protein